MKHPSRTLSIFLALASALALQIKAAEASWSEDFAASLARAKDEGKPVLLLFTGSDWCSYCILMENQVFSTSTFANYASDNLVLVKADFPRSPGLSEETKAQNAALAREFGVNGFPTVFVLSSNGEVLERVVGAAIMQPDEFVAMVERVTAF